MREIRSRRGGPGTGMVREVRLVEGTGDEDLGHAATVPAVAALRSGVALAPGVTFFVGENGSGKSTLVEAIAVACGLNPEGGGRHMRHATRPSHSPLGEHLLVTRGATRPRSDFFLRAESVFTVATELETMGPDALRPYGGRSLHEMSHGESFLAILLHRFVPGGLYVLDEPEAALSPQNVLTLLRRVARLVEEGSQLVIATHSPLLLALPGATILRCGDDGLVEIAYEDAPSVALTRRFLDDPGAMLHDLLRED